jgi:2-polyprenyl-3-methyl-5-hydroxy-6-metoxy-1,4-benzoquinol methylase
MNEREALIGRELMDRPDADPAELERSLDDLRRVNRWLGGTRSILKRLAPVAAGIRDRPVRILDVATGSADIPLELTRWGREHGLELRVTATDLHSRTVEVAAGRVAADPWITVERADALHLPYADSSHHIALCSTALHHFGRRDAVAALRELARVASVAVIVGDLRRSLPALIGARILAGTVWRRHPITRHDGPLSVRSAFTTEELRELAEEAGMAGAVVRPEPVFRISLVHRKRGGARGR